MNGPIGVRDGRGGLQGGISTAPACGMGKGARRDSQIPIQSQRIDIVNGDGRIRLALFNPEEMPDIIIGGVAYPGRRQGGRMAGLMFYDDEGGECGGLIFGSAETAEGRIVQGLSLTFDAYQQDQVVHIFSEAVDGGRRYGVRMVDRPLRSIREDLERMPKILHMPEGPAREEALSRLREGHAQRVFLGREGDCAAQVSLHDGTGQAGIRMTVAPGRRFTAGVLGGRGRGGVRFAA